MSTEVQKLWKLTAKEPMTGDGWLATSTTGPIIVRAPDAGAARNLASTAFRQAVQRGQTLDTVNGDAWEDESLTNIEEYLGGDFESRGPSQVLAPDHD